MSANSFPERVAIREVGPREGFQYEPKVIPTEDKLRLIEALVLCGFEEIQVTSFVNPTRVPQMADAEQVVAGLPKGAGVRFTSTILNERGVQRAIATGNIYLDGHISVSATEDFSVKNYGKSIEDVMRDVERRIELYRSVGVSRFSVGVSAAFGSNYSGDVSADQAVRAYKGLIDAVDEAGSSVRILTVGDTMGWANPVTVRRLVTALREQWDLPLCMHFHDTRGTALANAFAALEMGVETFDSSVGGLGGCPFGGFTGAAGNLATEDLVHLCDELGIATGVNCEKVVEAALLAEEIVGHELPGKVSHGGTLAALRRAAAGEATSQGIG
jgi:hydroxymethylglutaryl-CoA lyase